MSEIVKNISLVLIGFVFGILVMLLVMLITKDDVLECPKCLPSNDITNNDSESDVTLSKDEQKNYSYLLNIGKELYNNNKYKEFNIDENGLYFVSYEKLKNLGYDVSKYDNCNQKMGIIYFDPNNVLDVKYDAEPIQINLSCEVGDFE